MSSKGKGGKKHRRGKNTTFEPKIELPDEFQFFGYVTKILGNRQVNLEYYRRLVFCMPSEISWFH